MRRRVEGVRRHPGAPRGESHGGAGRDRRSRGPERLRQDHADPSHQRALRARSWTHQPRRGRAVRETRARDRRARDLPHVPDPATVRALHRARERGARRHLRCGAASARRGARGRAGVAGVHRPRAARRRAPARAEPPRAEVPRAGARARGPPARDPARRGAVRAQPHGDRERRRRSSTRSARAAWRSCSWSTSCARWSSSATGSSC